MSDIRVHTYCSPLFKFHLICPIDRGRIYNKDEYDFRTSLKLLNLKPTAKQDFSEEIKHNTYHVKNWFAFNAVIHV